MQTRQTGAWLIGSRGSVATTTITGAAAIAAGLAPADRRRHRDAAVRRGRPACARRPRVRRPRPGRDTARGARGATGRRRRDPGRAARGGLAAARRGRRPRCARASPTARRAAIQPRRSTASPPTCASSASATGSTTSSSSTSAAPSRPPSRTRRTRTRTRSRARCDRGLGVLPPSTLYALAAIQEGCAFTDFTPSTGARLPALEALAEAHEVPLGGSDGKTGETLLKSALAPMFAARALRVRSWAGSNLLGGGDGETLADPGRAQSKLNSKAARPGRDPRLRRRGAGPHRQRRATWASGRRPGTTSRFEGFLGVADEAAVHLGGLRLRARRAAAARPRPARGRSRSSAARPAS